MDSSDVDRLRSLAAMLKPLAELPAMLDRALSADQAVREAEIKAATITAENLDTMQASARIRDEINTAMRRSVDSEAAAADKSRVIIADAEESAKRIVDGATHTAQEILVRANGKADEASLRASTIDRTIADKTAEAARLEKRIDNARTQLKKMLES